MAEETAVYTLALAIKMLIPRLRECTVRLDCTLPCFTSILLSPPPFAHQIEAKSGGAQFPGPHKCNINRIETGRRRAAAANGSS